MTNKWILLAEDDAPLAELTLLALAADKLGCEVVVAHDGLMALDCLNQRGEFQSRDSNLPVFVLLDLKMPKMDGLEVLRHIKSDARLKHTPVIMFSSSREASVIERSYQLGANAYVVKPVTPHEFHEVLGSVGKFWAATNETSSGPHVPQNRAAAGRRK